MYTKLRREFGRHPVLQDEPAEVRENRTALASPHAHIVTSTRTAAAVVPQDAPAAGGSYRGEPKRGH